MLLLRRPRQLLCLIALLFVTAFSHSLPNMSSDLNTRNGIHSGAGIAPCGDCSINLSAIKSSAFGIHLATIIDTCGGIGCYLEETVVATLSSLATPPRSQVSEPGTIALLTLGLIGLAATRKYSQRA